MKASSEELQRDNSELQAEIDFMGKQLKIKGKSKQFSTRLTGDFTGRMKSLEHKSKSITSCGFPD